MNPFEFAIIVAIISWFAFVIIDNTDLGKFAPVAKVIVSVVAIVLIILQTGWV